MGLIGGTRPAYADLGDQLFKLLADDGAEFDNFGVSVAISGATAIVGARWDDDNGPDSGSAYLFDTTTGQQLFKLLPDDGAPDDNFGHSVAISGFAAIVGARNHFDNGSGSAYLFDITTGRQLFKLLADDGAASDQFGNCVAINGSTAIVGSVFDSDNGFDSGSAYLFDIITGQQLYKLLPDDGATSDEFGISVAISGATVIVGAHYHDDNGDLSGSAYLFDISDLKNPVQIAKLLADDGMFEDEFGGSVAICGTTAIVGARVDDDNGDSSGSAYLFDAAGTDAIPGDFNAFRGFYNSGDLNSLLDSDDDKLCYNPGIVLFPSEAPITLDFTGTLPNDTPASLDVTIESSANTVGLELTFSFWNYNTNSWDVVGSDTQSLNVDMIRTFAGDPVEHVEPVTGEVRTRYEVRVVSFIFLFPYLDCVDHVFWTTSN